MDLSYRSEAFGVLTEPKEDEHMSERGLERLLIAAIHLH
jgi:hypothetical protein